MQGKLKPLEKWQEERLRSMGSLERISCTAKCCGASLLTGSVGGGPSAGCRVWKVVTAVSSRDPAPAFGAGPTQASGKLRRTIGSTVMADAKESKYPR